MTVWRLYALLKSEYWGIARQALWQSDVAALPLLAALQTGSGWTQRAEEINVALVRNQRNSNIALSRDYGSQFCMKNSLDCLNVFHCAYRRHSVITSATPNERIYKLHAVIWAATVKSQLSGIDAVKEREQRLRYSRRCINTGQTVYSNFLVCHNIEFLSVRPDQVAYYPFDDMRVQVWWPKKSVGPDNGKELTTWRSCSWLNGFGIFSFGDLASVISNYWCRVASSLA